jgi:hypothetical protein
MSNLIPPVVRGHRFDVYEFWDDMVEIESVQTYSDGFKRTQRITVPKIKLNELIAALNTYKETSNETSGNDLTPKEQ